MRAKRQEADLERTKVQLVTMTCAPSAEGDSVDSLRQIAKVQREPRLKKAWEDAGGGLMEASTSNPKFPCIAVTSSDDMHYSGRALYQRCDREGEGDPRRLALICEDSWRGPFASQFDG